jgi:hypothetical protein
LVLSKALYRSLGRAPWTRPFGTETRPFGDAHADIDVDVTPRANIVRTIPSERGGWLFWDGLDIINSSSAKIWSTETSLGTRDYFGHSRRRSRGARQARSGHDRVLSTDKDA